MQATGLRHRLVYSAGVVNYALKDAAFAALVLLYYKQVLGLSGTLTGLAFAISVIWDAISDPLVGASRYIPSPPRTTTASGTGRWRDIAGTFHYRNFRYVVILETVLGGIQARPEHGGAIENPTSPADTPPL